MNVEIRLTGTSPLLHHNPRMVDPQFELNRQIKAITKLRTKTDEHLRQIEQLEWYGGIYEENGVIVQPTSKVRKCLINTARISKLGKSMERALSFSTLTAPLIYDGPKSLDEVFAQPRFHSRLSVGVGNKRVMRVRPSFFPWALHVRGLFVDDAGMNPEDLVRIVEMAGIVEGIGDNRVNGYGRFAGTVITL